MRYRVITPILHNTISLPIGEIVEFTDLEAARLIKAKASQRAALHQQLAAAGLQA
ncbi:MAG: hypothetical protein HYV16_14065 [Gammaproteobacteria bacterium]|nr:hypothetical protein [Gammaproteobacteria bacterium]